jgi:hypothetical protein
MISTIERLRLDADARLSAIAQEFGPGSYPSRQCERAWLLAEGQAVLAVLQEDQRQAERILESALGLLVRAPEAARRGGPPPEAPHALAGQAV